MAIEKPVGIDAAIDEAARAMTDGAPSEALRANVVRQIAAPLPRASAWRPLAAAAAALAIVAASVVWQRARPAVSEPPDRSAAIDPVPKQATPADSARAAIAPVTARATGPDREASRSRGRIARQGPGPVDAPGTVDIPPLAIAPVSPEEIELAEATLPPGVDIAPIAIRPLAINQVAGDQVE